MRRSGSSGTDLARCWPPRSRASAAQLRQHTQWRWHLDEVYVKINGEMHYLWRAVDHEGEVLESLATKERDKAAALKIMKRLMKRYGRPSEGNHGWPALLWRGHEGTGQCGPPGGGPLAHNRAENSHQPFRRRERAMERFERMKTLQKFAAVHGTVHNHFNQERHLISRNLYRERRSAALAEWRTVMG